MYRRLVDELKQQFVANVDLNLTHCPDPVGFYSDRVAQYELGLTYLAKYSDVFNEDNVFDVLAQVKNEIIDAIPESSAPSDFIEALNEICVAKEKKMSLEVYRAIEGSKIDLERMADSFTSNTMKRGCTHVLGLVEWIKGSNLHAELRTIEYFLDAFYRNNMNYIRTNPGESSSQSDFIKGATLAVLALKNRWFGLSPLVIKASVLDSTTPSGEWQSYTRSAYLLKEYSTRLDKFRLNYVMISGARKDDRLDRELRFFRSAKEHLVRLVTHDLEKVIDNIYNSRDVTLEQISNSPDIGDKQKQVLMYFVTSTADVVVSMARELKPQLTKPELAPQDVPLKNRPRINRTTYSINIS